MTRQEARKRLDAASFVLIECGWTKSEFSRMVDGLYYEDAVETAERAVKEAFTKETKDY